jgi:hypothetical protein
MTTPLDLARTALLIDGLLTAVAVGALAGVGAARCTQAETRG